MRRLLGLIAAALTLAGCGVDRPGPPLVRVAAPPSACNKRLRGVSCTPLVRIAAAPSPTASPTPIASPTLAPTPAPPPRPPIHQARIPMPPERLAELRAFDLRHYGRAVVRLRHPKLIVEHYTVSTTLSSPLAYWSDWRAPAEGEYPKTCAHFIVDTDGRIYQAVSLRLICRQALGVGYTSIGIEHVGMTDAQVIGNRAQMRSSLRLTRWLQHRYGIPTRRVIGHAEVPASRYFRDLVGGDSYHVDMQPWAMRRYRGWLRALTPQ